jgi:hypothetical protein
LSLFYAASIVVLFLTAAHPSLTTAFVSIFSETIKILAVIIASYLGVQTILDYKVNSNSNVGYTTNNEFSKQVIDINEVTHITTNSKDDDYEL